MKTNRIELAYEFRSIRYTRYRIKGKSPANGRAFLINTRNFNQERNLAVTLLE
jgi:hypothetical protein